MLLEASSISPLFTSFPTDLTEVADVLGVQSDLLFLLEMAAQMVLVPLTLVQEDLRALVALEEADLEQLLLQLLNWLAPTLELADFSEESLERLTALALGLEVLDCLVLGVLVTHHFGERLGCGCLH